MKVALPMSVLPSVIGSIAVLTTCLPAIAISFTGTKTGSSVIPAGTPGNPGNQVFNLVINNTTGASAAVTGVTINFDSLTIVGGDLSDIELYLSSPGSAQVLNLKDLFTNTLETTYTNVTFADAASQLIGDTDDSDPQTPITGSFLPEGSSGTSLPTSINSFSGFNAFNLDPGFNTWNLTVFNSDTVNSATLGNVTLNVTAVPFEFEATGGMFLLGGTFAFRHWLKKRKDSNNIDK